MKDNGFYIYKITNTINGKYYIGKSTFSTYRDNSYYGSGQAIKKAIRKYGKDVFIKEILDTCETEEEAYEKEKEWISKTLAFESSHGYNLTPGGKGFTSTQAKQVYSDFIDSLTEEERKSLQEKRTIALQTPEIRNKISSASKRTHLNRTEEEKETWRKKVREGWSEAEKEKARQRMKGSERKGVSGANLEYLIGKYGEKEGRQRFSQMQIRMSASIKSSYTKLRECPSFEEYWRVRNLYCGAKQRYNKNKISEEEFHGIYQDFLRMKQIIEEEKACIQ